MRVLIAGDYVPRNRVAPLVEAGKFDSVFGEVHDWVQTADYSILNFESPVVDEQDKAIVKCGPNLRCTVRAIDAIEYAGFKCVTLANNHIRDFGDSAVLRTMRLMKERGIDYVGAGKNLKEASSILYKHIGEKTLAIINCCENEFSIATIKNAGANPLNPVKQYYTIREARSKADYVIVIIHGGHELYQLPSPRMQDVYRFFIDTGADLVVNHHQHCFSGFEIYNGKPIVYGLGNFCMDKMPIRIGQHWNYGYMVLWDTSCNNQISVIPYEQCGEKPMVHILNQDAFASDFNKLNSIISNREDLETQTADYYNNSIVAIKGVLEPFQNKYLNYLQKKHIIPSFISKRWLLNIQNYTLCESHRDKMDYFFNKNNSIL